MSSQFECGSHDCHNGSKAIDGLYRLEPEYSSLAHTNEDPNPWIQIELTKAYCISAVKIWNRHTENPCKVY